MNRVNARSDEKVVGLLATIGLARDSRLKMGICDGVRFTVQCLRSDRNIGEGAVQACWDASHIRGHPCHYRDAGKSRRDILSAALLCEWSSDT